MPVTTRVNKKMGRTIRNVLPIAAALVIAFMVATRPALGQIVEEGVRQDNVETLPSSRPIVEYIIAGVCIFGSLAIGFKSSNRAAGT